MSAIPYEIMVFVQGEQVPITSFSLTHSGKMSGKITKLSLEAMVPWALGSEPRPTKTKVRRRAVSIHAKEGK